MSEDKKVIGAMLVAAMMVASAGAVLAISAGYESFIPGPEMPTYGELTYTGQGAGEGIDFNYSMNYTYELHSGMMSSWSRLIDGERPEGICMPNSIMWTSGSYFDTIFLETVWGQKVMHRYLDIFTLGNETGLVVAYQGAETTLVYRTDLVMTNLRATYTLVDTNITEIAGMDLQEIEDTRHLTDGRTFEGTLGAPTINEGPCYFYKLVEPEKDERYEINFTSERFTVFILNENDIRGMIDGGYFLYDQDLSIVEGDNGTILLPQGLYFMMGRPDGDMLNWDQSIPIWFTLYVTVIED